MRRSSKKKLVSKDRRIRRAQSQRPSIILESPQLTHMHSAPNHIFGIQDSETDKSMELLSSADEENDRLSQLIRKNDSFRSYVDINTPLRNTILSKCSSISSYDALPLTNYENDADLNMNTNQRSNQSSSRTLRIATAAQILSSQCSPSVPESETLESIYSVQVGEDKQQINHKEVMPIQMLISERRKGEKNNKLVVSVELCKSTNVNINEMKASTSMSQSSQELTNHMLLATTSHGSHFSDSTLSNFSVTETWNASNNNQSEEDVQTKREYFINMNIPSESATFRN